MAENTGTNNNNFVMVSLRGAGQVFFMENALTGLLFLIAIGVASYASGVWATTIGAVLGMAVATLTAQLMDCDGKSVNAGLFGFNGVLVGVALPTFIAVTPALWFYIIIGAAVSTVVTATFSATLTKSWGIPGSTGPFVLTAWLMVAGAYSFGSFAVTGDSIKLATEHAGVHCRKNSCGVRAVPVATEPLELL